MMDWSIEPWIKVYTRNTASWLSLTWEARALFMALLRAADREGRIEFGTTGTDGLALVVLMPSDVVSAALSVLECSGCAIVSDGVVLLPNFGDAQLARSPGAERQRRYRERRSLDVTPSDAASHVVTRCNARDARVTCSDDQIRSDQNRSDQNRVDKRGVQRGESPDKPAQKSITKKPRKKPAHELPADWRPNAQHAAYCRDHHLELVEQADAFRDHHASRGNLWSDWDATFRTWLRNAIKFADADAAKSRERIAAHEQRKHSTPDLDRVLEAGPDGVASTLPQDRREGHWLPDRPPSQPRRVLAPPEPEQSPAERQAQLAANRARAAEAMAAIRQVGRVMPPATGTDGET